MDTPLRYKVMRKATEARVDVMNSIRSSRCGGSGRIEGHNTRTYIRPYQCEIGPRRGKKNRGRRRRSQKKRGMRLWRRRRRKRERGARREKRNAEKEQLQ